MSHTIILPAGTGAVPSPGDSREAQQVWSVTHPDDVTVSFSGGNTLNIIVPYEVTDLTSPNETIEIRFSDQTTAFDFWSIRDRVNLDIINNTGVTWSGYEVSLRDIVADPSFTPTGHPSNAHFHSVPASLGGLTFNSTGTAPRDVRAEGSIAAGATAPWSETTVLHQINEASVSDSFNLFIKPIISAEEREKLQPTTDTLESDLAKLFDLIDHIISAHKPDLIDFLVDLIGPGSGGNPGPGSGYDPNNIDWNAVAEDYTANWENSGQWWVTPGKFPSEWGVG